MVQYYISNNDQPQGPFSLAELSSHGLHAHSMIWSEGMPNWQPAHTVIATAALLPKSPPPLPQTPPALNYGVATPPPVLKATQASTAPVLKTSAAPNNGNKKWLAVGGGIVVLGIASLMGFNRSNTSNSNGFTTSSPASASEYANGNETELLATKAAQEQQAAVEAQQKEEQRKWNRKHFLEYVSAEMLPGYSIGIIGGITSGYFQFTNNSGYRLQNIVVAVNYITSAGNIYTTKYVTIDKLPAHSSVTQTIPDCERGVQVVATTNHVEAPGLEYIYDAQQTEDAATAEADRQAEAQ